MVEVAEVVPLHDKREKEGEREIRSKTSESRRSALRGPEMHRELSTVLKAALPCAVNALHWSPVCGESREGGGGGK